jgi:coproporphyrinogen III oxidase
MIDGLTDEQSAFAEQMLGLVEKREAFFLSTLTRFNGSDEVETRVFDFDVAVHEVSVARGEVIEKGGYYVNRSKKDNPPYVPPALWDRYVELDFHPTTPLLGQLHATIYFTYLKSGDSAIAGYMDYTPGVWIDEDVVYLKETVDTVFAEFDQDVERSRQILYKDYHKDKLKAACVGAAFYVRPMLDITKEHFAFVEKAHKRFVDAYLEILSVRKDQPFTEHNLSDQRDMRRRWLEDHLFSDPFTMHVVPYAVWSFADAPPSVHF